MSTMQIKVLGFEVLKELYKDDLFFGRIWENSANSPIREYVIQDGFLFKNNRLCIPTCSLREAIILEAHGGGLAGYFG